MGLQHRSQLVAWYPGFIRAVFPQIPVFPTDREPVVGFESEIWQGKKFVNKDISSF